MDPTLKRLRIIGALADGLQRLLPKMVTIVAAILMPLMIRAASPAGEGGALPEQVYGFLDKHCLNCHDSLERKGDLDMEALGFGIEDRKVHERWVHIFDRAADGEMPPKDRPRPDPSELREFLTTMQAELAAVDRRRIEETGRSKVRRLNRHEYESSVAQVLSMDWLQIADRLPEDGTAHLFNKVGEHLDVSHVQVFQYMEAAEFALRVAKDLVAHPTQRERFYAREEPVMRQYMTYRTLQRQATRAITPLLGLEPELEVIRGNQPVTVGAADPDRREREAFGTVSGTYAATTKYDFTRMDPPIDARYIIRLKSYTYRAGLHGRNAGDDHGITGGDSLWWLPSRTEVFPGNRSEPVTLYALADSGDSRWVANFDSHPEPTVVERVVDLKKGEGIRPDATRLVRTRPGFTGNPNASPDGIPGLALNWLELEGPLHEEWPPQSYRVIFGDLPFDVTPGKTVVVRSGDESGDARRLLQAFWMRAMRRETAEAGEIEPYLKIYERARELGDNFTDAMVAACVAILCSPEFIYFDVRPGPLDDRALADRLAYFLWNGPPDGELDATKGLNKPEVMTAQARRLLDHPRAQRFIKGFLDYWLDLRDINANTPDATLYPDYYLDDWLTESSLMETRLFFSELIEHDLPVRNFVHANFTYVNERLADHYDLPAQEGWAMRRVTLPDSHPRGGFLTQASVLRVTANGTTTTPVLRGEWVMRRIMGLEIPPPPSGVGAVEPDTRGATTIREQLKMHTESASCRSCHVRFDPVGFALESFDVAGGWRDRYRALGDQGDPVEGYGKNGHAYIFREAQAVDSSGEWEDGTPFGGIHDLRKLFAGEDRRLARNFVNRLIVYATGAPVSFSDRDEVERLLDEAEKTGYGTRSLILGVAGSALFKIK